MKTIEWMAERSYLNCHAVGVHSLRLDEKVRAFIATNNHDLYKNDDRLETMSVGFHPHHCDIKMYCLAGKIKNIIRERTSEDNWDAMQFHKYEFVSGITHKEIKFKYLGLDCLGRRHVDSLGAGKSLYLRARDIHTVFVKKYQTAIWVIEEGMEDLDYVPYCWSNCSWLNNAPFYELYKKPTIEETTSLLRQLKNYL